MVRNIILSRFQDGQHPWESGHRKIANGPLYAKDELIEFLNKSGGKGIRQWTTQCMNDVVVLELDNEDLAALVLHGLKTGIYLGSEWCQRNDEGQWAACDAYRFTHEEWIAKAHKRLIVEYYFKLAISKTGALLLLISFHLSR